VKRDFTNAAVPFRKGEVLTFKRDEGYSRYDDEFLYEFHADADPESRSWRMHHDDALDSWKNDFELLDD
jgi:hypothetical protein